MLREELNRLLFPVTENDAPAGLGLMRVDVSCKGNAPAVLTQASEALAMVLSVQIMTGADLTWCVMDDIYEYESTCSAEEILAARHCYEVLQGWFERNLTPNLGEEDYSRSADRVMGFAEGRDWYWWSARVVDENLLHVYIQLEGFPVSGFDDLRWLLMCAGASRVEQS